MAEARSPIPPRPPTIRGGPWMVTDDFAHGFALGDRLINTVASKVYTCVDNTDGVAVWKSTGLVTSLDNQNMAANLTSGDEDLACDTAMAHTPSDDGLVEVRINGHTANLGDGSKVADCYFSADGGTNVRPIASVAEGDKLYWVGSVAGYELTTADRFSLVYGV